MEDDHIRPAEVSEVTSPLYDDTWKEFKALQDCMGIADSIRCNSHTVQVAQHATLLFNEYARQAVQAIADYHEAAQESAPPAATTQSEAPRPTTPPPAEAPLPAAPPPADKPASFSHQHGEGRLPATPPPAEAPLPATPPPAEAPLPATPPPAEAPLPATPPPAEAPLQATPSPSHARPSTPSPSRVFRHSRVSSDLSGFSFNPPLSPNRPPAGHSPLRPGDPSRWSSSSESSDWAVPFTPHTPYRLRTPTSPLARRGGHRGGHRPVFIPSLARLTPPRFRLGAAAGAGSGTSQTRTSSTSGREPSPLDDHSGPPVQPLEIPMRRRRSFSGWDSRRTPDALVFGGMQRFEHDPEGFDQDSAMRDLQRLARQFQSSLRLEDPDLDRDAARSSKDDMGSQADERMGSAVDAGAQEDVQKGAAEGTDSQGDVQMGRAESAGTEGEIPMRSGEMPGHEPVTAGFDHHGARRNIRELAGAPESDRRAGIRDSASDVHMESGGSADFHGDDEMGNTDSTDSNDVAAVETLLDDPRSQQLPTSTPQTEGTVSSGPAPPAIIVHKPVAPSSTPSAFDYDDPSWAAFKSNDLLTFLASISMRPRAFVGGNSSLFYALSKITPASAMDPQEIREQCVRRLRQQTTLTFGGDREEYLERMAMPDVHPASMYEVMAWASLKNLVICMIRPHGILFVTQDWSTRSMRIDRIVATPIGQALELSSKGTIPQYFTIHPHTSYKFILLSDDGNCAPIVSDSAPVPAESGRPSATQPPSQSSATQPPSQSSATQPSAQSTSTQPPAQPSAPQPSVRASAPPPLPLGQRTPRLGPGLAPLKNNWVLQWLYRHGYVAHDVPGDGDCLFHALAFAAHGELGYEDCEGVRRRHADDIRDELVAIIRSERFQDVMIDLDGARDRSAYCDRMSLPRTYGGTPEIMAWSMHRDRPVLVINQEIIYLIIGSTANIMEFDSNFVPDRSSDDHDAIRLRTAYDSNVSVIINRDVTSRVDVLLHHGMHFGTVDHVRPPPTPLPQPPPATPGEDE